MFKTLSLYRIHSAALSLEAMEAAAQAILFTPCGSTQEKSSGWVPPRGEEHGALVESVAGARIMRLKIETKSVPGAMVRKLADNQAHIIKANTGRKPGKKEMRALREDALLALLPQAFPRETTVWVWFDVESRLLMIDASSQSKADEVVTTLVRTFNELQFTMVQTHLSPATALTSWITTTADQWPAWFSIERACELRSHNEEKSVVKFNRHNIVTEEVRKHITEGKLPSWAAMSWEGRVGFVLTDTLQIKKIEFLEGVFDGQDKTDESGFDADVALSTGELQKLIPALIKALGGEMLPEVTAE